MRLKITTFNLENLFNRYAFLNEPWENERYEKFVMAVDIASVASRAGDLVPEPTTHIQRNNTALAIEEVAPDILAVQEIENMYTLRNFNHDYLSDYFDHMVCLDGNDPRAIDVGLLIRKDKGIEVLGFRTHIDDPEPADQRVTRESRPGFGYFVRNAVFSRDCLEVDVRVNGQVLTLLVNHFKAQDKKKGTPARRAAQARRVRQLAEAAAEVGRKPIVLGDLNVDSRAKGYDESLDPLLGLDLLRDPFPKSKNLWTHYYAYERSVSRLDYILVDRSLPVVAREIFRKGLTTKCKQYDGPRFPTIGPEHTEASDHCPTSVVVEV